MCIIIPAAAEAASLLALLDSDDETRQRAAKHKLERICFPGTSGAIKMPKSANSGELLAAEHRLVWDSGVVPVLREALRSGGPNAKIFAAARLGLLRDHQATDLLISAMSDQEPRVRRAAAGAFQWVKEPRAFEALKSATRDPDEETAFAAVDSLGALGDPAALPTLLQWTADRQWRRRQRAYWALRDIDHPGSLVAARSGLFDSKPQVRKAAKSALGSFDSRRRRRQTGEQS